MSGKPQRSEKLNYTLEKIICSLHQHNLKNWFISYGTLLGIVREQSCIDGDDDIDICIETKEFRVCEKFMKQTYKWKGWPKRRRPTTGKIIQSPNTDNCCRIDIYRCNTNINGDFYDTWEEVKWSNCYEDPTNKILPHIIWRGHKVYVPNNYLQKLESRYGPTWNQRVERGTDAGDGYRSIKIL